MMIKVKHILTNKFVEYSSFEDFKLEPYWRHSLSYFEANREDQFKFVKLINVDYNKEYILAIIVNIDPLVELYVLES